MASGPPGPVGVPVPCPVEEVPDREPGTAPILFHSMEEANVKGAMSRVTFAIVTLVQVSVGNSESTLYFLKVPLWLEVLKVIYSVAPFVSLWFRLSKCCMVAVMSV